MRTLSPATYGRLRAFIAFASLATSNIACSSPAVHGFADGESGSAVDDGGSDASVVITANNPDSGSTVVLPPSTDAAPQQVAFPCQPGTYSGMFTTTVTTDAGLLPSLFSLNWTGMLSITLVGQVVQSTSNGEAFSASPVLTIAPGAMLSGTDNFGGHFTSGLSGQLDCPTKVLTGTLMNGAYDYWWSDAGGIVMTGSLTGTYQDSPASLTGTIAVTSPSYSTLEAGGRWSALHQ
jgi:hypothetical protein